MSDEAQQKINVDRLRAHYFLMCRIRALEEVAVRAAQQKLLPGPLHPSIGQEAVAVGVIAELTTRDLLLSTHRGHGHTLAKGASSTAMFHELLAREGGTCGGKGGSMHIADFGVGMLGANGVVGANIVIAAGAAHAVKLKKEDRIVVCYFGDGAINRGPFLEGLNWAAVFKLPVLFVCEDNGYASTTKTRTMTAGPGLAERGRALGVPSVEVDGNDVVAVHTVATDLIRKVRTGEGPHLLHARTFRLAGHTSYDPEAYRPKGEVEAAKAHDPIMRARKILIAAGVAAEALNVDRDSAYAEMEAAYRSACEADFPTAAQAFIDVQDIGSPAVEAF